MTKDVANRLKRAVFPLCLALLLARCCLAQDQVWFGIQRMHSHLASSAPAGQALITGPVLYFGGPVVTNVQVVVVLWTSAVDRGEVNNAAGFYTTITNSPFMDLLSEYSTVGLTGKDGKAGSNQTIGHGSFGGIFTITPSGFNSGRRLSDTAVRLELTNHIQSGAIPAPRLDAKGNPNTIYFIYFPPGYTITLDAQDVSCVNFCAYHTTSSINNRTIPYSVIPDQSPAGACSSGCGNGATYVDALDEVASHELAEAVTDPDVGELKLTLARPAAWIDPNGGEIGDKCQAEGGMIGQFRVQQVWSNRLQGCTAVPAPAKFGVQAPPSVEAGVPFTVTVTAEDVNGITLADFGGTISFNSSDFRAILPANYTFVPADRGVHVFANAVSLGTKGSVTVSVASSFSTFFSPFGSANISVTGGPGVSVQANGPGGATAGVPFNINVAALDQFGQLTADYLGTVHFSSNDSNATVPFDYTFTVTDQGTHSFPATLGAQGLQTVTVVDVAHNSGATLQVQVQPGATERLVVNGPGNATAGSVFSFGVSSQDAFGNPTPAYSGTVRFSSGDPKAALPSPASLSNGQGTFQATFDTAGNQGLTATDTVTASITGSATLTVKWAAADHLNFATPPTGSISFRFPGIVTVQDAFGNLVQDYSGTVHFSASGVPATVPVDYNYSAATDLGRHQFNFTPGNTTGTLTLLAADNVTASIQGSASVLVVNDEFITPTGRKVLQWRPRSPLVIASFSDADVNENGSNLSASIDWGDGTVTPGIVQSTGTANGQSTFDVLGQHVYGSHGAFTITVTLIDKRGSVAKAVSTAIFWPRR